MSKLFHLEMITPERRFFDGQVEAVQLPAPDGLMGILAGHEPSVISPPLIRLIISFGSLPFSAF